MLGSPALRNESAPSFRCTACGASRWTVAARESDDREVREGELVCGGCARSFPVRKGIVDFLPVPTAEIEAEIRGWHEMAGDLWDGQIPSMMSLPYYPEGEWPNLAPDFFQVFEEIDFRGKRILDLGAGRTWSSRYLAALGKAKEVVALDVLTARFLGMETAEIFFKEDKIFFERLRGDMHDIPLRDGWADVVFSAASLHHSSDLARLFAEVRRVLAAGGTFVFVSEPNKKASIRETRPDNEETRHGINEHIYAYDEYVTPLQRLGFRVRRLAPRSIRFRLLTGDPEIREGLPPFLRRLAGSATGRQLLMRLVAWPVTGPLVYRHASLPLSVIATKGA
jgi:SAM-dependent methyltransferase